MGEGATQIGIPGRIGQEDAALVEEALAGAALGGATEFSRGSDDVEPDGLLEAGLRFAGMRDAGEFAFNSAC